MTGETWSAVVRDHRLSQRPDPDRDGDQVGGLDADVAELLIELADQRGVPVDDPLRHRLVAGPGRVLDQQAAGFGRSDPGRLVDGLVIGAGDDAHLGALGISSGLSGASSLAGVRAALAGDQRDRRAALGLPERAVVVLLSTEGTHR